MSPWDSVLGGNRAMIDLVHSVTASLMEAVEMV
jgi:hypothetical protein